MKIVIRPVLDPRQELDLTHRLTAAIAEELWRTCGGNERLNWLEAERHLEQLIGGARGREEAAIAIAVASVEIVHERVAEERVRSASCSGTSLSRERRAGIAGRRRMGEPGTQRPAAALTAV